MSRALVISSIVVAVLCASLMVGVRLQQPLSAAGSQPTFTPEETAVALAAPKLADMPGFEKYWVGSHRNCGPGAASQSIRVERARDGLTVRLTVMVEPDEAEAERVAHEYADSSQRGTNPHGTRTGRKIGQECWQSAGPDGRPDWEGYMLDVLHGRVVIHADMRPRVGKDANGFVVRPGPMPPEDQKMLEDQVINVLHKLAAQGYVTEPVVRD